MEMYKIYVGKKKKKVTNTPRLEIETTATEAVISHLTSSVQAHKIIVVTRTLLMKLAEA